ncbi:flavin reductase family protein [Acinetobacter rudis]|uniref:Iron-sulfur cluster-binding domain-containing protein n=1 Tax=Acinetobacter rudis TaxID=632955 RepID=A0AAW8J363_9GAMM|nr:iron-sulfur cluster-binding domain-containing protein [Acinetobacter rudis]MDQ8934437.1 iron-sulfur cluster-binding domain-containing protein [Acinetobacter rudis]MDQ9016663.1 iron-sulfur cluster-binding domain-containing protein [Acinetobacter rudis]
MHTSISQIKSKISLLNSVLDNDMANFWLQRVNAIWSVDQALGRVVAIDQSVASMTSLKLKVNRHFKFGQAGQHHPVIIVIAGTRYERSYSLTQVDAQHVLLSVKKMTGGLVSTYLNEKINIGDVLEFGQPYGDMCLTGQMKSLLLFAAGSGITPMYSLITQWLIDGASYPVQLFYWVKKHEDAAFKNYLEQLQQQHANFKFNIYYTQEQPADRRLNQEQIQHIDHLEQCHVYACGPSAFVNTAEQLLKSAQVFKSEAFSLNSDMNASTETVQVILTKSNTTVTIPKGQSILVGLEQQNLKPTHGCRMGICNKCVCQKVQGASRNLVNGSTNHEPRNSLKICVNSAETDLIIDL